MRPRHPIGLALLLLKATLAVAEEGRDPRPAERGFPLMRLFDDTDHGSAAQNFSVATDRRGYVYVGNLQGLLVADGARWRQIRSQTAIYAIASSPEGLVLAGGPQGLLTVLASEHGAPALRSIAERLPEAQRQFGDVRSILATSRGFAILTDARLLFYDGQDLRSVAELSREGPRSLFLLRGEVYLAGENGFERLDGNALAPSAEFSSLQGHRVDVVIEEGERSYLAVLRDLGLVRIDGNGLTRIDGPTSLWAKRNVVSCALRLRDGRIAFGSRVGGVLLADSKGQAEQVIDSSRGLPDDQVMELTQDLDGGLWVALNGGLARLDVASSVTVFDARAGVQGGSQGVFRHRGRLFVFGSAGLGIIEKGALRKIPGVVGSTWFGLDTPERPGEFLLAAASGVFRIADNQATLVPGTTDLGAYVLARASHFNAILVGARGGLYLLVPSPTGDRLVGPLNGSPRYVRSILPRPQGRVLFSTTFDGIGAVDIDPENPQAARFQKLGGLEGDVHLGPDGPMAITNDEKTEIFRIDEETPRLIRDEERTKALVGLAAWVSASDSSGELWVNTNPLRVFRRVGGSLQPEPVVLHSFPARRIQAIRPEADGVVWVGGETGLFRHVGTPGGGLPPPKAPVLATVTIGDRRIYDGWDEKARPPTVLPPNLRRLHVGFGPLSHQRGLAYQFRLDPLDGDWSDWSPKADVEFTTLQEAQYRFRMRTRGADGQVGPEASWSFVVDPPWHRTAAAHLGSVLALALLIGGAVGLRTRALKRRTRDLKREAERLSLRVEEKTRDLQLAVRDLKESRRRVEEQNRLLQTTNARLEDVSRHDSLTGIANRRHFDLVLSEEWPRARRQRTSLVVGILDLDHFKALNDAHGHPEGDDALRQVAQTLKDSMRRPADLVARYGGDEFAFILSDTDRAGAVLVAEDTRARVEALRIRNPGGPSGHLTVSIGLAATVPEDGRSADALIEAADRALYLVKAGGGNRVQAAGLRSA